MKSKFIFILILIPLYSTGQPISYSGGNGDGFSMQLLLNTSPFYNGGEQDGFTSSTFENGNNVYKGDGFTINHSYNTSTFYHGGINDGFTSEIVPFYFIWNGSIGTGWGVGNNWNTNAVPTEERRVRIPAGVPNFPFLNAGTLKVGDDSGTGTFQAKEIIIEPGALMVGRINNFIENYGLICVEGVLEIRNPNLQAFKNLNGAQLIIKDGGEFRTNY